MDHHDSILAERILPALRQIRISGDSIPWMGQVYIRSHNTLYSPQSLKQIKTTFILFLCSPPSPTALSSICSTLYMFHLHLFLFQMPSSPPKTLFPLSFLHLSTLPFPSSFILLLLPFPHPSFFIYSPFLHLFSYYFPRHLHLLVILLTPLRFIHRYFSSFQAILYFFFLLFLHLPPLFPPTQPFSFLNGRNCFPLPFSKPTQPYLPFHPTSLFVNNVELNGINFCHNPQERQPQAHYEGQPPGLHWNDEIHLARDCLLQGAPG